jgi:hypothetical protein
MDRPFVWLNRKVFVSHGNFIMSRPGCHEDFDCSGGADGAVAGNPGSPVFKVEALDRVRLLIHAFGGSFVLHGDPSWPGACMYPFRPERERNS